jgi:hypothetical protein
MLCETVDLFAAFNARAQRSVRYGEAFRSLCGGAQRLGDSLPVFAAD